MSLENETKIRHANEHDVAWIVNELIEFSRNVEYKKPLFNDVYHVRTLAQTLIKDHVFFISHKGNVRTGLMTGCLNPHFVNPDLIVLTGLFWWVPEEYRNTRGGYMLFNEFRDWGIDRADWVIITIEKISPVKTSFLTKRGFREMENSFVLEV